MAEITIKDIAKECGVGVSTVSRALNNHPDINPETRRKIMEVIERTGFIPNNSARNLKRTDAKCIAMLVKGITNPFFSKMIEIIEDEAKRKRYALVLRHVEAQEDELDVALELEKESQVIGDLGTECDDEAKAILIEHNLRLVVYIAKKFDNTGVGVEDLISIGTIGLIKSINTFKPDKNIKLATYASRCIENEILMYLRRNNKTKLEVSIDEPLNVDWDGNELLLSDILGTDEDVIYRDIENEVERKLLMGAISKLSEREKRIIKLRFGLGTKDGQEMTQKEVASLLGISQSYISRLEKKIMRQLKKEMSTHI